MTDINKEKQNEEKLIISLVIKAKNGDAPAFNYLYQRYLTPIYRYIYIRVKSQQDAEDLTQITFIKAWKAIQGYQKQTCPFSSWLYRIAKNTVIDYYRKNNKKDFILDEPGEILKQIKDFKAGPDKDIQEKEGIKNIIQSIKHLSKDQQEIIILKLIDGLSNREISELLNKKEEAIRALQYRGLKVLREILKKQNLYD